MRRLQETLSNGELNAVYQDPLSTTAEVALKEKRLTFTWLDGEKQKVNAPLFSFKLIYLFISWTCLFAICDCMCTCISCVCNSNCF